jgi:alkylation response protein AidB-like acyl-CoA dehydrogenase
MTSSDNETWQPEPPALLPPWHTPEREKLQEQARRFAMDEVLPVANELDPQKGEIPASLLARLAELGYFGITVPAEQGGLGLGVFEYCMVSEELARAWMSTASILARS